jgi:hypothetical protein
MTFDEEAEETARPLIGVFFQVSRSHRTVARFPTGVGPREALLGHARASRPWDADSWVDMLGMRSAGDHYLRCYAPEEHQLQLAPEVFEAFRRLGGGTYSVLPLTAEQAAGMCDEVLLREFERLARDSRLDCTEAALDVVRAEVYRRFVTESGSV